jgi:photosystem II stability/assembly factor-like uncharacterized protein
MATRKRRKAPVGYYTTHKPRSAWFHHSTAFPLRDADPREVERRMFVDPSVGPQGWEPMGPSNFAGRVTSLAIHAKTGMLFAGTAGGGVWRSPDLGKTWLVPPLSLNPPASGRNRSYAQVKSWPSNAVGSLAIDPHNPDHILCGMGEANGSADNYPGCGIFHSLDAGETWRILAYTDDTGLPRRIGALAVDPGNPNHIRAGGATHNLSEAAGLFFSTDGGITWSAENFFNKGYDCHAVVFGPRGAILATLDARGVGNGIWRLPKLGAKTAGWMGRFPGLPDGICFGRTSLAVAPSERRTVYALAGNRRGGVLGVFRSDDGGNTWRDVGGRHFRSEQQASYTNCIAVHPEDPEFVVAGGLDVHVSRNGGKTWVHASDGGALPGTPRAVHDDQHALVILKDGTIVAGSDGGVYVSPNGGKTWSPRLRGMQTTMFYALDVAATNPNAMGGGCQDNGTLVRDDRDAPGHFRNVIGGDGIWLVYDREESQNIFGGYHEAHIFRHRKGERDRWVNITPPIHKAERKVKAIVVMAIDPFRRKGRSHKYVYLGTNRIWRTANWGESWKPVSPDFDGTAVSAIAIAPEDPNFLMVGTNGGGIYRSEDGANTWSENFAGAEIPPRMITSIQIFTHPGTASNPKQPQLATRALCTVAATGLGRVPVPKQFHPESGSGLMRQAYSHVFACLGHGEYGWKDADGGRLPDVTYRCCAFETRSPYRAFVGGDFGVIMVDSKGFEALERSFKRSNIPVADQFAWANISGNLPNVIVTGLVYHHDERALYAGTYGRGIWRLDLSDVAGGSPVAMGW